MARKAAVPSYRRRMIRGREQAIVTLIDAVTKERRDFYLGDYGTSASRERYLRLVSEWEARGRRLTERVEQTRSTVGPTVTQICHIYWTGIQGRYSKGEEINISLAIRILRTFAGELPAASFGPNNMRRVRDAMTQGDPRADPPRQPWARSYANSQTRRIRQVFKWAVAHELVAPDIHQALCTLEPLRRNHPGARETVPVGPAPEADVRAIKDHVSRQVATMIELQLLTGMRPGEVCAMRPTDIDTSGAVWLYTPAQHKTSHRGRRRTIYLGPRAQEVLKPFLCRRLDACCFSPAEAEAERREELHANRETPLNQGNSPGTNRVDEPRRQPGPRYTVHSYNRAINRACKLLDVPTWHPHQLRHNYATNVRKQHGLEAAQILLGHSSALITDAVYAERDMNKAVEIARMMG